MAFDWIEISHKSDIIFQNYFFFLPTCAICSELPTNISTRPRLLITGSKASSELINHRDFNKIIITSLCLYIEKKSGDRTRTYFSYNYVDEFFFPVSPSVPNCVVPLVPFWNFKIWEQCNCAIRQTLYFHLFLNHVFVHFSVFSFLICQLPAPIWTVCSCFTLKGFPSLFHFFPFFPIHGASISLSFSVFLQDKSVSNQKWCSFFLPPLFISSLSLLNPLTYGRFSDPYFKKLCEGLKLFFFHRGIRNKKFSKVLSKGQKLQRIGLTRQIC